MKTKIFVIDDEPGMIKVAREILETHDYEVLSETDPLKALARIEADPPHLIMLDIRMPKLNGFEVCKKLKKNPKTEGIPVVIVSIENSEADVVLGLELGAEDYVQKPIRQRELLARVGTVLRRFQGQENPTEIRVGPFALNQSTYEARLDNKPLPLSEKEFELLAYFLRRDGHVVTRAMLSENVWKTKYITTSRTIDAHVKLLRKKLGIFGEWIKTLKGIGYRFDME